MIFLTALTLCEVKSPEKRRSKKLIGTLGLGEPSDILAIADGMRWYGYVLKGSDDERKRTLDFEVVRRRRE